MGSYTRALLASQDRWHLFVTPVAYLTNASTKTIKFYILNHLYTKDKKEKKTFLIYKEIQNGAVA
jgi:hypothetical protein